MESWDHTSALLAMVHNVNCSKLAHRKDPRYFHPYRRNQRKVSRVSREETRANLNRLAGVRKKSEENGHA